MPTSGGRGRAGVPSSARQRVKALLSGFTVRERVSHEDELWERTAHYGLLAERTGWTIEQIETQPHWYITRLPGFFAVLDEIREEKAKKAAKT